MGRIHNLHTLQLEKERLKAECRMKEMQLQQRLNGLGDALPDLLWFFIPRRGRSLLRIVRQLVQAFTGGGTGENASAEARMFSMAFQAFRKIFSRKKANEE